jgi:hypothetical protein
MCTFRRRRVSTHFCSCEMAATELERLMTRAVSETNYVVFAWLWDNRRRELDQLALMSDMVVRLLLHAMRNYDMFEFIVSIPSIMSVVGELGVETIFQSVLLEQNTRIGNLIKGRLTPAVFNRLLVFSLTDCGIPSTDYLWSIGGAFEVDAAELLKELARNGLADSVRWLVRKAPFDHFFIHMVFDEASEDKRFAICEVLYTEFSSVRAHLAAKESRRRELASDMFRPSPAAARDIYEGIFGLP